MIKRLLSLLLLFSVATFSQTIVINELDADTPGTDALEFIELKSSAPNFSLDGYVLVLFDGTTSKSYRAFDLDGLITDSNGIVTLGNSVVSPAPDRIINNSIIQNGPDGIALYLMNDAPFTGFDATQANLIDALIHKTTGTNPDILMSALNETMVYSEGSTSAAYTTQSIQRKNDGTYEAKSPTPDVPNDGSGSFNFLRTTLSPSGNQIEGTSFNIVFTLDNNVSDADLNFTYTLTNGTFTSSDYTGSLSVTIPIGSKTASKTITLIDDALNEGDETILISIGSLPSQYTIYSNNIQVRVHDNDYTVQPWGTPLNPTYGLCTKQIPNGYYNSLENKSGAQLKQAIQDIIANPIVVREHSYLDVWEMLNQADQDPTNSSNVWLMYVEVPRSKLDQQNESSNVGKWNREHIYCQSRGKFNLVDGTADGIDIWQETDANDIQAGGADGHHIRSEDGPENSSRNNRNYGVDYNGPTGNAGSWRGDVARACFYMAVRYNGLSVVNGDISEPLSTTPGPIGDLATLLAWNKTDTADDFEVNRNNVIYNWQKNRNPFIDYPLLVDYVFGDKVGQTWNASLATENFNQLDVVMYPNPSNGFIQIAGLNNSAIIEIFSITGQKVLHTEYEIDSRLDLNLAKGVYMAKISEGEKYTTKKLVIK